MTAFEQFWLPIGDRVACAVTMERRTLAQRRVLAARAFERWRTGRLSVDHLYPVQDADPQNREPTPRASLRREDEQGAHISRRGPS